jgi:hypothetical protein
MFMKLRKSIIASIVIADLTVLSASPLAADGGAPPSATPGNPTPVQSPATLSPQDAKRRAALVRQRELLQQRAQARAQAAKQETAEFYARQKISPTLVQKYDANKNGRLDLHEWEKYRKEVEQQRAAKAPAN